MTKRKLTAVLLTATLVCSTLPVAKLQAAKKVSLSSTSLTMQVGKTTTLKLNNNTKKVTWSVISGKSIITLSNKTKKGVTVKANKVGNATIQAKVSNKKYTCKVNVKEKEQKPTPQPTTKPLTQDEIYANREADTASINTVIEELVKTYARIPTDVTDTNYYTWGSDGHLVGINWESCRIEGTLSLASLKHLVSLNCSNNNITSLDVSQNTNLETLQCSTNKMKQLDISKNAELTNLDCSSNELTALDITNCNKLKYLNLSYNALEKWDSSSANKDLLEFNCSKNQIRNIDTANYSALTTLNCSGNLLLQLDVSKNTALQSLLCFKNYLKKVDVTSNTLLLTLNCDYGVEVIGFSGTITWH